jgi:uncharacterized protein (TIGR04222 family)
MDWLIHNPIADIHGPAFLLVYGVIALIVITVAYLNVRARDKTGRRTPPLLPGAFDPYEAAYLRGGRDAVILTALYALYQRGVIRFSFDTPPRLVVDGDSSDAQARLPRLERRVLDAISPAIAPSRLIKDKALEGDVDKLFEPFRNMLVSEQLLRTDADKASTTRDLLAASAILVALSVYKIVLAGGRPFGFLTVLTLVALFALWLLAGSAARARVSDRGRAYLKRLQAAYGQAPQLGTRRNRPSLQRNLASIGDVGLFGAAILSTTPDAAFASRLGGDGAGGGCGGGGGGSCGGGGGCGGGCGGCGG